MKKLLSLFLLASGILAAQTPTVVSATVTDPNGSIYANGSYTAQLVSASGAPYYNLSQVNLPGNDTGRRTGSLDANGSFSIKLLPNAGIATGSQWALTICSDGPYTACFTSAQTISGSTQNLTSALSAVAVVQGPTLPKQFATKQYVDAHSSSSGLGLSVSSIQSYGDSLTAGNEDGSGNTYPLYLQTLLGSPDWNGGVGGNTSTQIGARQGGVPALATIVGGSIPTSGGVQVTFATGAEPVTVQGPTGGAPGILDGVAGTITLSGTYTFTRTLPGAAVTVSSAVFTPLFPSCSLCIIWSGRNNYSSPTTVLSDNAAMAAYALSNGGKYLFLSVINSENPSEYSGQTNYNTIIALNAELAAAYGANYIDVRSALVASYNPNNAADVIDHGNDIPPYSLRAQDLAGTLNGAVTSTTTCVIPVILPTGAAFSQGYIVTVDSELIFVNSFSGTGASSSIQTCTRGYASTTAATHLTAAVLTGVDPLHLGALGLLNVANQISTWIKSNYPALNTNVTNPSAISRLFSQAPIIGSPGASNDGYFGNIHVGTNAMGYITSSFPITVTASLLFPNGRGIASVITGQTNLVQNAAGSCVLGFSGNDAFWQEKCSHIPTTTNTYSLGLATNVYSNVFAAAHQITTPLTVSTLPTCTVTLAGQLKRVTDATTPTYNGTLTGGGTVGTPVYCDTQDGSTYSWRSR